MRTKQIRTKKYMIMEQKQTLVSQQKDFKAFSIFLESNLTDKLQKLKDK
jgi:hypothetical protein